MITVTNLRKIFTEQGVKGAGKWNREIFDSLISQAWDAAIQEDAARKPVALVAETPAKPAQGKCTECGRNEDFRGSGLCEADRTHGEWENAHADEAHNTPDETSGVDTADCWICHPELDGRKSKRAGRSRAGMVIIAKGTEIHKSETFRAAADSAGWTVTMMSETYDLGEDAEGEGTRYYATATRGDDSISLAWDGRAYDYPMSSAVIGGKARKIRNLKEALRVL
jgi:hypothetical protein